jgi:type II secretory pathway pseudopilin PulG
VGTRGGGVRGISQIEVLVAMLIIGLAAPLILGGIFASLTRARTSQDQSAATAWAQGEIDYLRGQCFSRLTPGVRKITAATLESAEPQLPDGIAAALVRLEAAGPAAMKVTISLYKEDWPGEAPAARPILSTATLIGDIRVATVCP